MWEVEVAARCSLSFVSACMHVCMAHYLFFGGVCIGVYVNTAVWQRDAACDGASGRRFLTLVLFKEKREKQHARAHLNYVYVKNDVWMQGPFVMAQE